MNLYRTTVKKLLASISLSALVLPMLVFGSSAGNKPLTEDQKIIHTLNRLGFGPRPGDVAKVKAMGLQKYIEAQLNPTSVPDAALEARVKRLEVFDMSTADIFAKYPNPGALLRQLEGGRVAQANAEAAAMPQGQPTQTQQQQRQQKLRAIYAEYNLKPANQLLPQIVANRVLRAAYSERQLQEVMVDFWQNHFNVFSGKQALRWYIPSYERDVLRKNALGNFKDLVVGTAQHPAMLFFLDNYQSVSPNMAAPGTGGVAQRLQEFARSGKPLPKQFRERVKEQYGITDAQLEQRLKEIKDAPAPAQRPRRGINENYARELMELHTLGVDGGYSQKDIIEVAKAFTGWTIADPRGDRRLAAAMIKGTENRGMNRLERQLGPLAEIESGEFIFNPRAHEAGPKMVLGQKVDEGGVKDGLKVIDILVNHPSTAKFIAKKLAVKFVSDNPKPELVARIADAFQKSKGDIKVTLRALFSDKEFFAAENYRSKIKSPFELAVSSIRTLGAETNAGPAMLAMLNKLGEVPYGYQAPTGYPDTAADWVNTGALLERLNFAVALASNRIPGTKVDLKQFESKDKAQILDRSIATILGGEISPSTRTMLQKQSSQPLPVVKAGNELPEPNDDQPMRAGYRQQNRQAQLLKASGDPEVFKVVSLVLGSPDFQRQ